MPFQLKPFLILIFIVHLNLYMFTLPQTWRGKFGSGPEHLLCELVQREGVEYGVWTSAKLFKSGMCY